jgi:glutaredoxin-related protein
MVRPILPESAAHPAVRDKLGALHADAVAEVQSAIATEPVVVVGMSANPFPRKARRLLDEAGIYLSQWRRRNALKMWTGWPTLPMIFVRGVFVGGFQDLKRLHDSGELKRLLG